MEKYFDISLSFGSHFLYYSILIELHLWLLALSVIFGTFFGLIIAVFKLSGKIRLLRFLANSYTTIMRCTPSIVLLFLVYYGVPAFADNSSGSYLQDVNTGVFVVITFTLTICSNDVRSHPIRLFSPLIKDNMKQLLVSV